MWQGKTCLFFVKKNLMRTCAHLQKKPAREGRLSRCYYMLGTKMGTKWALTGYFISFLTDNIYI